MWWMINVPATNSSSCSIAFVVVALVVVALVVVALVVVTLVVVTLVVVALVVVALVLCAFLAMTLMLTACASHMLAVVLRRLTAQPPAKPMATNQNSNRANKAIHVSRSSRIRRKSSQLNTGSIEVFRFSLPPSGGNLQFLSFE